MKYRNVEQTRGTEASLEFRNSTELVRAPEFALERLESFDTRNLRLHLKYHRRKDQEISGYYRFEDFLVVAAVRRKQRFPLKNEWPVGSRKTGRGRGWAWVWDNEPARNSEELMVWICGHELFHFLRHTKQISGINRETRANRFAFEWLRAFKAAEVNRQDPPPLKRADGYLFDI